MFETLYDVIYNTIFDMTNVQSSYMGHEMALAMTYLIMILIFIGMIKFVFMMISIFKIWN
jgi:hypothetical protein